MGYNHQITVLESAARTASINSGDFRNRSNKGARVHIKATAASATPSVVFTVQGKDQLTGDYFDLLASAAVTATGDTFLTIYPAIAVTANVSASTVLPSYWRVKAVAADADSLTYSITADLLD